MRRPSLKVSPLGRGDLLTAVHMNQIRGAIIEMLQEQDGFANILRHHLPNPAVMMRLKSSNGDYWTCRRFDGSFEGADDVFVAKPWELRPSVTAVGPQTYSYSTDRERTATEGSDNETQVIVPDYVDDESVIFACRALNTGVVGPSSVSVRWLDLNVAGRGWAKKSGS